MVKLNLQLFGGRGKRYRAMRTPQDNKRMPR